VDQAPTAGALAGAPDGDSGKVPARSKRSAESEAKRREDFEALAIPLLDRLYAMALHLVREPARADDMVQETYLRAWQNFDRFQLGTHFKAWIFQILTYLFLNDRRSAQRREASVDFTEHDIIEAPESPDGGVRTEPVKDWEALYPVLVDDALKHALDRLGSEQRTVFLLVTLGELSYQETAEILKLPIGTVMSRLFRARKQLQTELADYAKERGLLKDQLPEDENER
jgi:RNA polymerase sigma-70 factor, ECF subfamily